MAASGERNLSAEIDAMEKRHADIIESLVAEDRRNAVMESVGKYLAEMRDVYKANIAYQDLPEKTLDVIVSFGERMSSLIVANIIDNAGHCDSLDFIKTEKWFNKNIADRALSEDLIRRTFGCKLDCTMVCGGFISRDRDSDEITNLGRGGSDYTAALIAAALDADLLEDLDGCGWIHDVRPASHSDRPGDSENVVHREYGTLLIRRQSNLSTYHISRISQKYSYKDTQYEQPWRTGHAD